MAEEDQVVGEESPADERSEPVPIVRDPTFVRLAADLTYVMDREGQMEIALIVDGPDPVAFSPGRNATRVKMAASFSEVARLRIDFGPAMNMAMNIIERNLNGGRVNVPAFRAAFEALIMKHDEQGLTDHAASPGDRDED